MGRPVGILSGRARSGRPGMPVAMLRRIRPNNDPPGRLEQPSLADLDELATQARRGGLPVELAVEGTPAPLPAGVDLAAYLIAGGAHEHAQARRSRARERGRALRARGARARDHR